MCAGLFLATTLTYFPVAKFDFVNFDDPEYVTANPHVRGLTHGIKWAFTSGDAANWFPVTRLSHLLDVQVFGLESGWHHVPSVLIHAFAVLLLFAFLSRATQVVWPAAFVALLFALHPLHVESVAWAAERKDVLSAFFWFLTLWTYVRYTEKPGGRRYALVLASFALGLMSKPMIVTLPFTLVLLDYWPLRRRPRILTEKLPFFALSAVVALVTLAVQRASGAVAAGDIHPFPMRVENAILSYAIYIVKMLWPARLAVFYPYPEQIPQWELVAAAATIAAISIAVWRLSRSHPYLAAGWLWYLVTLIPVIGLVQVGAQARADRYTYVPMTGVVIMLAFGTADLVHRRPRAKPAMATLGVAACVVLVCLARMQTLVWANSGTLFQHALDAGAESDVAHHNLGNYLAELPGRLPEAIGQYEAALRINPDSARTRTDLGNALAKDSERLAEAVAQYHAALRIADSAVTRNDLANTLSRMPGRLDEAIAQYRAALAIDPDYSDARSNLAIALRSGNAQAHLDTANALMKTPGRAVEAVTEYEAALRIDPNSAQAQNNLGIALTQVPARSGEAFQHFEAAVRLDPDYADAHVNLGIALSQIPGRLPAAIAEFEAAMRIKPDAEVRRAFDELRRQRQ
jgi:tetratricopeptide (TPR) repeat protein